MTRLENALTRRLGIKYPIFCGAMYPCSNPELVAAASEAGAIGIVQPLSLTYVYGYDLKEGIRYIRGLTKNPIGMNVLIEQSSQIYLDKMKKYVDLALAEGVRFFITALGNPRWVVEKVHAVGGTVFHDVTSRKWALKAVEHGVDGLICVNRFAGGHAGTLTPEEMWSELFDLGRPLVCAGGIGSPEQFRKILALGYQGVQMGTRFIATRECLASPEYKAAILAAEAKDIVLTERLSGVPVAVIATPTIQRLGTKAGPIARWLLRHRKTKHWMRLFYSLRSFHSLKKSMVAPKPYQDVYQAGKSVEGIESILSVKEIVDSFVN